MPLSDVVLGLSHPSAESALRDPDLNVIELAAD